MYFFANIFPNSREGMDLEEDCIKSHLNFNCQLSKNMT